MSDAAKELTNRAIDDGNDQNRLDRFKVLKKRAVESAKANKSELYEQERKDQIDPKKNARNERRRQQAELELEKLDAHEEGKNFERQRAWDWTVQEAEEWDEKLREKQQAVETSAFSDYSTAAERAYLKEIKNLKPDLESYENDKLKALKNSSDLTIIENKDNQEMIVYDKNESIYRDGYNSLDVTNKPSKAAIDRLVQSLKEGDERRMKRRRPDDDSHITYINEKNKQFNQKLSRHYDKYNKEIRDAFERGTAL